MKSSQTEMLKKALAEFYLEEYERAASQSEIIYSRSFERKMRRLFVAKNKSRLRINVKKPAFAFAAVIIMIVVTLFLVSATRIPILKFITSTYEKFTAIIWQADSPEQLPQYIEEHYAPEWLPESYVIDPEMTEDYDLSYVLTFSNDDGDEILFSQYTIDSTNIGINTEGVETVTVSINGHQGLMYSNQGVQTIVWNNHKYGFTLSGSLAMEK